MNQSPIPNPHFEIKLFKKINDLLILLNILLKIFQSLIFLFFK